MKPQEERVLMNTYKGLRGGRGRGVSPVIATVILVAMAVTVSVAVAYWMGGLAGQYTEIEMVEIQSAACFVEEGGWIIRISLKNKGTKDVALTNILVNSVEVDVYDAADTGYAFNGVWSTNLTRSEVIESGEAVTLLIYIDPSRPGSHLTSGTMVTITIHSSGGVDYPTTISLV